MAAHTISVAAQVLPGAYRKVIATLTGSASYDAGGSVVDLSATGGLGANGFTTVRGLRVLNGTAAADGAYYLMYVPAALNAAATGMVYVQLTEQATPADTVGATNLSARSWLVEITGA